MITREAHTDHSFPFQQESARFCVKWGSQGSFNRQKAAAFLQEIERCWDIMTGRLGFAQTRGWQRERRDSCRMNIYIAGTGLTHPGDGCYLGCDPEGIHFASTTEDLPTAAHEVGHLAEIGTASSQDGFINNPQVGWIWEACSQWILYYFHNDKPPGILSWLNQYQCPLDDFNVRYDSWLFFHYLQRRFGEDFVGRLWSMAVHNELPFAAIQRALVDVLFPDVFADFAARCATWDFEPGSLSVWLKHHAGDENGWSRFTAVREDGNAGLQPADRYAIGAQRDIDISDLYLLLSRAHFASIYTIVVSSSAEALRLCWFGFHVIDLRPWVSKVDSMGALAISVIASPYPSEWRIALVRVQADGGLWRLSEGWTGDYREFKGLKQDRAVMLVICPAGRHNDQQEQPQYSLLISAPAPQSWACSACTYKHEGRQNQFLACAVCGNYRGAPSANLDNLNLEDH